MEATPNSPMKYMLIASADRIVCETIGNCFRVEYKIDATFDNKSAVSLFQKRRYEFLFIDVAFLQEAGPEEAPVNYHRQLSTYWDILPSVQIIILCTPQSIRKAVDAVRSGASNYLSCPIDQNEARYIVDTTLESVRMQYELDYLRDQFWHVESLEFVQTNSPLMKQVLEQVKSVAATDTTILITGDTGTGKGVLANLIHNHSRRKEMQFISVHCGAIPDNLLESEIFGHEKGAFTGAIRRRLGKFEIAQGGTIFLDEIGTMPLSAQIKLLQVLQDRLFQRVGGEDNIRCDVRVIAAANNDLQQMTDEGTFRKDLYYRLNVFPIEMPPLRKRREDIPFLIEFFLRRLNKSYSKNIRGITPEVLRAFEDYSWPGNIRELENLVERAYLLETSTMLKPESFPHELFHSEGLLSQIPLNTSLSLAEIRRQSIDDVEQRYLSELLRQHKGRIRPTALSAGITTRQLHKLLTRYEIKKEDFKTGPRR